MKFRDLFLGVCVVAAAGWISGLLPYPWNIGFLLGLLAFLFVRLPKKAVVMRLCGLTWTQEDFFRGWMITGRTGSGKTQSAINNITFQCFENMPRFGAVCLDQKGLYHETLSAMAAHFTRSQDLVVLQTRPPEASVDWQPVHTINLLGNNAVPALTYAKLFVDTADSLTGKSDNPFFPTKAQLCIQTAIEILRYLDYHCTVPNLYKLLLDEEFGDKLEVELGKHANGTLFAPTPNPLKARQLLTAFRENYRAQPREQLGGVQATIETYLGFFMHEDLVKVFSAEAPTFSIDEIADGKILCVAMPQKFQAERIYVNTILKLSFYFHVLQRFDKTKPERDKLNPLILFADEGQEIVSAAESAFADHRSAGVMREAGATIVFSTQAYTSIYGALDEKYADVLKLNLSNQLVFTCADQATAEDASKQIGEREVIEKTWTYGGGKRSVSCRREIKPFYHPFQLRKLGKFVCICIHCEGRFRKRFLTPINPNGSLPKWFRQGYPIRWLTTKLTRYLCTPSKPSTILPRIYKALSGGRTMLLRKSRPSSNEPNSI